MLSDVLSDAISSIEDYQREYPDIYDDCKDHIEIVKKVMAALMNVFDESPVSYPPNLADTLSDNQKEWFRATCEANIARWAERLRLLGPVTAEELVGKLDEAIQGQEAMLAEMPNSDRHAQTISKRWGQNREQLPAGTRAVLQEMVDGSLNPNWHDGLLVPNWFNTEHVSNLAGQHISVEDLEDFKDWIRNMSEMPLADGTSNLVKEWLAEWLLAREKDGKEDNELENEGSPTLFVMGTTTDDHG